MNKPNLKSTTEGVLTGVEKVVETTEERIEETMKPIRESVLKRFPIVFLLMVTFGITATMTGMEQILIKYELFQNHPGFMLMIGIGMLIFTGTLYKKLG